MSKPEDRKASRVPVWLVGKVQGGMEFATAGRLRRQGVKVKCPGYIAVMRPARMRKVIRRAKPAYPGYVFIDRGSVVDLERVCLKTKGFMHIVSFDDEYSECPDAALMNAIEYKKKLERENYFGGATRRGLKQSIRAGVIVTISEGPFRDFEGKVTKRSGNNASVEIDIFGRPTAVWVPVHDLVLKSGS